VTSWQITIDCSDPSRLVAFWAEVLGYEPQPPPEGFTSWNAWYLSVGVPEDELDLGGDGSDRICDPRGEGPNIWFQPVPEPKPGKNRLHFDIFVGGGRNVTIEERRRRVDARVSELVALGGSIRSTGDENDHYFVVMHDPEGNEFCVA
jgi:catechol 2,3-dioxygenase-like lactoylglutathione lyase family enzyme